MTTALVRPDVLYAWAGSSLLVVNTRGECGDDQRLSGYYFRETRFVRTLRLEINGKRPWPCEAASIGPRSLAFTYIHPEITEPGGGGTAQSDDEERTDVDGIPERAIDIKVSYVVGAGYLDIGLTVANRSRRPATLGLTWIVDADYADLQEAENSRREQTAATAASPRGCCLELRYEHPRLPFRTAVTPLDGQPWTADENGQHLAVRLGSQQALDLSLRVTPSGTDADLDEVAARERETAAQQWRDGFTRIITPSNRTFEQTLSGNIRDFSSFPLLDGESNEWLALQAGMPLYPAFFGRDAVTAGWQAGMIDYGQSLSAALTRLARMQSDRFNDWRDEQPGRIPYQMRSGPLARLNINPYSAYYADYASPLMFVISLANLFAWTGDPTVLTRFMDPARRILDWARECGDLDGDGYLEYQTRSSKGTKNQGWKDSGDAVIYDDGAPVPSPIGTCELQAYWYAAQQLMAALCWMSGNRDEATAYARSAAALKDRFNRDWWLEDEGSVALAMDPHKHVVRAATSNIGHCLASGIINRDHLRPVVGRMFAPDMFSGWGIRTLSSNHGFYNPLSYHRGTVWAVEQATIVFGLRRFGFDARALELSKALFDLAQLYPEQRIPECVGGYARGDRATPGAYPRANTPQLWNATAFPLVLQSILGLLPLAPFDSLVVDPALPHWLPDVVVRDLRVGQARVTLKFWRTARGDSEWEVVDKHGTLRILRQPPLESIEAGFVERAGALLETITH